MIGFLANNTRKIISIRDNMQSRKALLSTTILDE